MTDELPAGVRFIERDWLSANHVLMFDDDRQATIIDTGYDKHVPATERIIAHALATMAPRSARLTRIINTHLHSDHCGGNARLAAVHRCDVIVPIACSEAVRDWDTDALSYRITGQRCERFAATGTLTPGESFRAGALQWQIHAAPGHDPTSLVFFEPDYRILISADALWENGFGVIFPELIDESGFTEQAAVLDLIESLAPATVIPGHGRIFHDTQAAIGRARSRLEALMSDPQRNHRNALKVLVKFLLLDHEHLHRDELLKLAQGAAAMRAAAAGIGMSLADGLIWAADSLARAGQITFAGDRLSNA